VPIVVILFASLKTNAEYATTGPLIPPANWFNFANFATAFVYRKVGLASAMAVVLLLIVLLVTWLQRKLVPDEKVTLAS
jgi:ABC-type sugar transport system permease subunit